MLRELLQDRFKLVVHTETREGPVYVLTMIRSGVRGPNLCPPAVNCAAIDPKMGGLPISELVEFLGQPDGRVVIDKTGLTGAYEFTMRYRESPGPLNSPSLFTALEEQ